MMTQELNTTWTAIEQETVQKAFNTAYKRESAAILQLVQTKAGAIAELDDLWHLNDFLNARRHELDGKYDSHSSAVLFTFAGLIKEGWLQIEELQTLSQDKLAKINALARM